MKVFPAGRRTLQRPESGMISHLKLRTTFALWRITSAFPVSHSRYKPMNNITINKEVQLNLMFVFSSQLNGLASGNPESV